MEAALTQRDPKQVTSALRRCVLNAERCVQRMRLTDIVLSVSASQGSPHATSQKTSSPASNSTGNETDQYRECGLHSYICMAFLLFKYAKQD